MAPDDGITKENLAEVISLIQPHADKVAARYRELDRLDKEEKARNAPPVTKKADYTTAWIREGHYCNLCGWPVIYFCTNGDCGELIGPPHEIYDWGVYCSSPMCIHHDPPVDDSQGAQNDWISR
jgi:hypothetical protein